jgi:hypothetical protein
MAAGNAGRRGRAERRMGPAFRLNALLFERSMMLRLFGSVELRATKHAAVVLALEGSRDAGKAKIGSNTNPDEPYPYNLRSIGGQPVGEDVNRPRESPSNSFRSLPQRPAQVE